MKSIIEEASSVSKAIEKGWTRAGKPKNFSVKIYEEAEKNFFGLTTRSAKIALIFDEKTVQTVPEKPVSLAHQNNTKKIDTTRTHGHKQISGQPVRQPSTTPAAKDKDVRKKTASLEQEPVNQSVADQSVISEKIKTSLGAWIKDALVIMRIPETRFDLETEGQTIRIVFAKSLLSDDNQEKALFKSFSYLALTTLRTKFKKGLRGLKLIFTKKSE